MQKNDTLLFNFLFYHLIIILKKLQLLSKRYLSDFQQQISVDIASLLQKVEAQNLPLDDFSFYTSVAAVYSSKIEGEAIELDSYLKSKMNKGVFKKDYTTKIDDLQTAYLFARQQPLSLKNVLKTHQRISKHLLNKNSRGKIRQSMEYILNQTGRIEYVAAPPIIVELEAKKLFKDIKILLKSDLTLIETFYYASFIHLVFLKIHPLEDGNGRTARLLEKWFLATKIGERAWHINSEKYYYDHLPTYYKNIHIGFDYEDVNYDRALSFLLMLVQSLKD